MRAHKTKLSESTVDDLFGRVNSDQPQLLIDVPREEKEKE
jgi:hypothetical protein